MTNVKIMSLAVILFSLVLVNISFAEKHEVEINDKVMEQINIVDNLKLNDNLAFLPIVNAEDAEIRNYERTELDKLFQIMAEKESQTWREGDILIASATILAFFGFASVLTVQFRGNNRDRKYFLIYVDFVLTSIFVIQFLQLVTISIIVSGVFHWVWYLFIISSIIFCLFIILLSSRKIINLQNSGDIKMKQGNDMIKEVKEKYTNRMMEKAQDAIQHAEELNKLLSEEKNENTKANQS